MADNYLERRREDYEARKAEWLRKKKWAPKPVKKAAQQAAGKALALLALLLPAALHAADIGKLEARYSAATKAGKAAAANAIFRELAKAGLMDGAAEVGADTPADSIDARVWYWLGEWHYEQQEYAKAEEMAGRSYPLLREGDDKGMQTDCLQLMAAAKFKRSDYAGAVETSKKGLETVRQTGDKARISSALNNIAAIYLASKQPERAEKYILEALEYSTQANDSDRISTQNGIASEIYHIQGKEAKALEYARKAYEMDSLMGREEDMAIHMSHMASALAGLGDTGDAMGLLLRAIPILAKEGNKGSLGICYNQMGGILNGRGRHTEAAAYFSKAIGIFSKNGNIYNESRARKGMFDALRDSDPSAAAGHLLRYTRLQDSIYKDNMERSMAQFNAQYRNGELEREKAAERTKKVVSIVIGVAASAVLLAFVAWLLSQRRLGRKRAKERAALQKAKDAFFAQVTHEFRTPLAVIDAAAHNIRKGAAGELRRDADNIIMYGRNLLDLINQILELARMEAIGGFGHGEWVHGDVNEVAALLCDSHGAFAESRGVGLSMHPGSVAAETDFVPDLLRKALQNIISNAVKFTPAGGTVTVRTSVVGTRVAISVADTGRGMDSGTLGHIFTPFYCAEQGATDCCSGIGLPLARKSVESMGGEIRVESEPGRGSVFTIVLPLRSGHAGKPAKAAETAYADGLCGKAYPAGDGDTGKKALIVEDNAEIAGYIAKALPGDYSPVFAANGKEGLETARQTIPDIVVTDMMMPIMDGYEMVRRMRGDDLLCHIPVVMVTARTEGKDRMEGFRSGVDAYVGKPFQAEEIRLVVERLAIQRAELYKHYLKGCRTKDQEGNPVDGGFGAEEIPHKDIGFMEKFETAVKQGLESNTTLEQVASQLFVTRVQLNRKVKALTGRTASQYMLGVRTDVSKALLDDPSIPIGAVAAKVGISDVSYFSQMFKAATGFTPSQYREMQG